MSEDTPRIIESQVDWITAIGAGQPWADRLASFGQHLLALEVDKGNKLHEFECYSYRGHHSGQASLGWQDDRTLVQLSGQLAADKWGEAMKHSTTVTRLDLQVTAVIVPDDPDLAERLYARGATATYPGAGTLSRGRCTRPRTAEQPCTWAGGQAIRWGESTTKRRSQASRSMRVRGDGKYSYGVKPPGTPRVY